MNNSTAINILELKIEVFAQITSLYYYGVCVGFIEALLHAGIISGDQYNEYFKQIKMIISEYENNGGALQ